MHEMIQEYAKRLKLSWIRENFHTVNIEDPPKYLLTLFEKEVEQREERKINLLFKTATLPNVSGKPFDWTDIKLGQGLSQESVLDGDFIAAKENMIFYGGVGAGKTYLSTLIGINAIQKFGRRVKFYTVASLANELWRQRIKVR